MSKLVLASQSPRRRELLALLGIPFEVVYSNVNESPRPGEAPADFVARTAREKGTAVAQRISDAVILSADTIVSLDGGIFGKPRDTDDAVRMLQLLSGRQHSVLTAVSVIDSSSGDGLRISPRQRSGFESWTGESSTNTSSARTSWIKPAHTPSKASLPYSFHESKVIIRTCWGCRCH